MQKEYIGRYSLKRIRDIIDELHAEKIMLVTGKKSFSASGAKSILDSLLKKKNIIKFNNFEINPKLEDAYFGIELIRQEKPDLILAIGGGSVIDMAKLINILAAQIEHTALEVINDSSFIYNKGLHLVAIPTTAGTGSEATHFSVVYVDNKKYSLAHKFMLPDYAIVDSSLTYNLPKNIAASSAMDALSQAVESYWAIGSTDESKKYAKHSIEVILQSIEAAVIEMDTHAKDLMSIGSNLSGKAINISKTTAAHAISYPITTYFNVPHGHAVALMLGNFFILNYNRKGKRVLDPRGKDYLDAVMNDLFKMFGCSSAKCCYDRWYELMELVGLSADLSCLDIRDARDIELIIENINIERMSNNPTIIDGGIISSLFK